MRLLAITLMLVFFVLVMSLANTMYFSRSEINMIWLAGFVFIGFFVLLAFKEVLR